MNFRPLILIPILCALIAADRPRVFSIGGKKFTMAEIVDARALPDVNGSAAILVTLDDKGTAKLAKISRKNREKPVSIALNGQTIFRPVLHDEITDGVVQISGLFSVEEATKLARAISGKDPLPDSLGEDIP